MSEDTRVVKRTVTKTGNGAHVPVTGEFATGEEVSVVRYEDGQLSEVVKREVKPYGNNGQHVYVPKDWLGETVRVVYGITDLSLE